MFRHRALFLSVAGGILLLTLLVVVFTPRSFQSEMSILVRNARPDYLLSPERSNGQLTQNEVTEERIGSEIEVLKSRDIADAVVDPNWSATPLSARSDTSIRAHDKAVLEFSRHLTVEPVRKSNVIRVAFTAADPSHATQTLERLLQAFLAKQREMERSTGASSFFGDEASRYKDALDQAQQQLAVFQENHQIVSLPARETTIETQVNLLEDAIRSAQVQITEASDRVASDKRQLAVQPARQSTILKSVPTLQSIEQLTAMLANYQNKRTELLTRYQPGDRLVVEVNQQIADTTQALATARASSGLESTTDVNPVFQQLKAQLATSTSDLAALEGRLLDLTAQRDRLKQQLNDVEGATVEYTTLQSRVAELENNFQLYTQKKNEAGIADAMNQQQLVNVAVSERPTFSEKRFRPQILLDLALGLFTAIFLGCCAVFFAELGRETIDAPWELDAISTAPVLATIPWGSSGGEPMDLYRARMSPQRPVETPAAGPPATSVVPSRAGGSPLTNFESAGSSGAPSRVATRGSRRRHSAGEKALAGKPPAEHVDGQADAPQQTAKEERPESAAPELPSAQRPALAPRDATCIRRAAVLGYEQILLAYAAARRLNQQSVQTKPSREEQEAALNSSASLAHPATPEPSEAASEPTHRSFFRTAVEPGERVRLSPSQRAALHGPELRRDGNGRIASIASTVDPRARR